MTTLNKVELPPRDPGSKPNPKWVHLLKASLDHLWDGLYEQGGIELYVCLAVGAAADRLGVPWAKVCLLTHAIEMRVYPGTFDEFAQKQGVTDRPSIQAARRTWILDMIQEFGGEV